MRRAAAAGMVLVRNDGVLPLAPDTTVALLGPHADLPRFMGGGSATVIPAHTTTPVEGLETVLTVRHTPGVRLEEKLIPVPLELVTDPDTGTPGVSLRYLDGDTVIDTQHRTAGNLMLFGDRKAATATTLEIRARLRADVAGAWQIGVGTLGQARLELDGETALDETITFEGTDPVGAILYPPQRAVTRTLAEGQEVDVRITVAAPPAIPGLGVILGLTFGITRPQRPAAEEFAAAVELARTSDVAVVVVGTTEQIESEGFDRTDLRLPGRQDELVAAVAAANPRTVVVVNSGAPVEMPWRDDVAAVLLSWFPGQELGPPSPMCSPARPNPAGDCPPPGPHAWPTRRCCRPHRRPMAHSPTPRAFTSVTGRG